MQRYASQSSGSTLRDELNEAIQAEEKKLNFLRDEERMSKEQAATSEAQIRLWSDLIS